MFKQSWEKYSLIIIGNIVFFALLYFISYRPNNDENRASEFLSMAQSEEAVGHYEAAMVLFSKVVNTYPKSRAAETAETRLPIVKKAAALPLKEEPPMVQPRLDLEAMLNRRPSVYIATFLAKHYNDDPLQIPKIRDTLNNYLWIATNYEGINFQTLKNEREFQGNFFQKEFFNVRPGCVIEPDWIYDDFYVKNTNFFPWRNVNINLKVTQGNRVVNHALRIPYVAPGAKIELLEFRVSKSGGLVLCDGSVSTEEGSASWQQQL